jgi:hypothetical protein
MLRSRLDAWLTLGNLTAEGDLVVPEDLTPLSDADLASLLADAVDSFDSLYDNPDTPVADLTALASAIQAIKGEQDQRAVAAEAIEDAESPVEPEPDPDEPPEAEVEVVTEPEPEPVLAAAAPVSRPSARSVRRSAPAVPAGPVTPGVTIVAAADLPGIVTGSRLAGLTEVAAAATARAQMLNDPSPNMPVARFNLPIPATLTASGSQEEDWDVIQALTGLTAQQNLLASGGWCAPSTPLYDLYAIDAASGLLDLPTVRAPRGGLLIPESPDISDVMSHPWLWTEANDENPTTPATKPCIKVPCPTWSDCRLDAHGICVTAGNLQDRAFPEMTRRFIALVLNAHAHVVSKRMIDAIVAASGAAIVVTAVGPSTTGELLGAVDLAIADYKSKYRMAEGAVLEVLLPAWTEEVVRSDLARRAGVDLLSVTDARVRAYFTDRNAAPQFLQDFLPLSPAGGAPVVAFPANIDFVVQSAGTYIKADNGTLDLGVVRDSTLNETNDHTAAWSEQFFSVCKVGYESRLYRVASTPNGVTGCCDAGGGA